MIKAVGFDWGGVLVTSKPIVPGIAKILGIPEAELYSFYLKHNHLAGVGNMSYHDLWSLVLEKLGHSDKREKVLEHMLEQQTFQLDTDVLNIVDKLRAGGYKVGLLSNNTKENGGLMRDQGLDFHFDVFLISAEIGHQKPNPEAFQILFDKLEVKPDELIFVDDSTGSLSRAEEIGYHPLLFKNAAQLQNELETLGVKI